MNATEFCYWFQGYIEITKAGAQSPPAVSGLSQEQLNMVERHLALVFQHDIDPKQGPPAVQQQLQAIHDGFPPGVSVQQAPYPVTPPGTVVRC